MRSLPIIKFADGIEGSIVFVLKLFTVILVESILSVFKFTISIFPNNSILSADNFINPVVPEPI